MQDIFKHYYETNFWRDDESVSGQGSNLQQTTTIREALPLLFEKYRIKNVFDIPCGDYYWWQHIENVRDITYVGADIVPELIRANVAKYGNDAFKQFVVKDITHDPLPPADLILCRDLLGHFSNLDVQRALLNIKASHAKYLLATTFPGRENSTDIQTGQWRPINLASLFGLPNPIEIINENCTEGGGKFKDKSLGLWRLQ